jgi:hypothetical protein
MSRTTETRHQLWARGFERQDLKDEQGRRRARLEEDNHLGVVWRRREKDERELADLERAYGQLPVDQPVSLMDRVNLLREEVRRPIRPLLTPAQRQAIDLDIRALDREIADLDQQIAKLRQQLSERRTDGSI